MLYCNDNLEFKLENYINKILNINVLDFIDDVPKNDNIYIISDPPYNQKYHYDNYDDNLSPAEYGTLLRTAFEDRKSVIIHYPEETINILSQIYLGSCEQVVSWVYNSNTAKQHRLITWWNNKPDMRKVGQPYKNPTDKRIKKRIEDGKQARLYDWWEINQVKNVSKKNNNEHTCPIPIELARRIISITTNEGDIVVDPFCGSGTICVAAKQLNRNWIGLDISKKYCKIAEKRLQEEAV